LTGDRDFGHMHLRSRVYGLLAREWAEVERRLKSDPSRQIAFTDANKA